MTSHPIINISRDDNIFPRIESTSVSFICSITLRSKNDRTIQVCCPGLEQMSSSSTAENKYVVTASR
nr:hypothetical protein Iba_chr14cCG9590 [Ipomoea batatas]